MNGDHDPRCPGQTGDVVICYMSVTCICLLYVVICYMSVIGYMSVICLVLGSS